MIHAATFAACPPAPTEVAAGVSVSGSTGPASETTTSRCASPRTQIMCVTVASVLPLRAAGRAGHT